VWRAPTVAPSPIEAAPRSNRPPAGPAPRGARLPALFDGMSTGSVDLGRVGTHGGPDGHSCHLWSPQSGAGWPESARVERVPVDSTRFVPIRRPPKLPHGILLTGCQIVREMRPGPSSRVASDVGSSGRRGSGGCGERGDPLPAFQVPLAIPSVNGRVVGVALDAGGVEVVIHDVLAQDLHGRLAVLQDRDRLV
jgi:hypothetical protein